MRVGTDLQSISELRSKAGLYDNQAIFTEDERAYCKGKRDPWRSLGGILCAKEASLKALHGYDGLPDFSFRDLEICHEPTGRPQLRPGTRLLEWMTRRRIGLDISISHSGEYVMATAIASVTAENGES
jgi:holo-[acyl-carrier protein] synthase